jgi:hypothetical protein
VISITLTAVLFSEEVATDIEVGRSPVMQYSAKLGVGEGQFSSQKMTVTGDK